jgi:CUB domain
LTVQSFNTEAKYDKLYIFDGPDMLSFLVYSLSGKLLEVPNSVRSVSGCFYLCFSTDQSVMSAGFVVAFYAQQTGDLILF